MNQKYKIICPFSKNSDTKSNVSVSVYSKVLSFVETVLLRDTVSGTGVERCEFFTKLRETQEWICGTLTGKLRGLEKMLIFQHEGHPVWHCIFPLKVQTALSDNMDRLGPCCIRLDFCGLWWILVWLCYYETSINHLINVLFWPWALQSANVHPWIFKTRQKKTKQNKTKTSQCCFKAMKEDSNISSYLCPYGFLFFFFKFPPLFQVPHVEE